MQQRVEQAFRSAATAKQESGFSRWGNLRPRECQQRGAPRFRYTGRVSSDTTEALKQTSNHKYRVIAKTVPSRPGSWNVTELSIYLDEAGFNKKLGGYVRNYNSFGVETWLPFSRGNKDYALYSRDYTSTRLMELPSCTDIGGEDPHSGGFCPVEYYIPDIQYFEKVPDPQKRSEFVYELRKSPSDVAFVAGCIWGDDSSWKIQCIDLLGVESGVIRRDARFGYAALPKGVSLRNAVTLQRAQDTGRVIATLAVMQHFDFETGEIVTVDPFE